MEMMVLYYKLTGPIFYFYSPTKFNIKVKLVEPAEDLIGEGHSIQYK